MTCFSSPPVPPPYCQSPSAPPPSYCQCRAVVTQTVRGVTVEPATSVPHSCAWGRARGQLEGLGAPVRTRVWMYIYIYVISMCIISIYV